MSESDRPFVGADLRELRFREAIDRAQISVDERRRDYEEVVGELNVARSRLATCVRERAPVESELVFGDATCACGARMAHWPDALHEAWECSAVLLRRTKDGPGHDEPRLFVVSGIRTERWRRPA